jgi:APA family basic amino acid/polyamine antiporter
MGAMIGSGIFVLLGMATARYAGPAVMISFALAALGCVFAGLCYAEFASMIPLAGSAYTYGYVTLGELFAWIIGWDLVLEYGFGAATVASGWSGYVLSFLGNFGTTLPPAIAGTRWDEFVYYRGHWESLHHISMQLAAAGIDPTTLPHAHGVFNLLASLVIAAVTLILVIGVKESADLNSAMVLVKIGVLVIFVVIGAYYLSHHPELRLDNWRDFLPRNTGVFGRFGWSGVCRAAAFIFFAYIGFDAIATTAQEAKNPQRDLPVGILASLGSCTVLYVIVASVLISLVNYKNLDVADPLAVGIEATGLHWG